MKTQVVYIHGGDTFDTYDDYIAFLKEFVVDGLELLGQKKWKLSLDRALGENFEVVAPQMPNKTNAKYAEWKIWFEKQAPFLHGNVILIGHSLGGIFLAKYLSENRLPINIKALFLVAAPFDDKNADFKLADFTLPNDLSFLQKQVRNIYLYHSQDDPIVPFIDLAKYQKALPDAKVRTFNDRAHFSQAEFPELIRDINEVMLLGD